MLHDDIKELVDSGNVNSLKYTFSDLLDGDPTFKEYEEDYEYCKKNSSLFEPHKELTSMSLDNVNEEYWVQLKNDFVENSSIERFEHMRKAAKILYKDRIDAIEGKAKIEEENKRKAAEAEEKRKKAEEAEKIRKSQEAEAEREAAAKRNQAAEQARKESAANHAKPNDTVRKVSEPSSSQRTNTTAPKTTVKTNSSNHSSTNYPKNGNTSKKSSGMGAIIAIIVVILLIIIIAKACSHQDTTEAISQAIVVLIDRNLL
jgi:Mg-chelatase subunit ChlI